MIKLVIAVAAVSLGATACSGSASSKQGDQSKAAAATSATTLTTSYGQDAALIATHITGCSDVHAGDIGNGAVNGVVAKAECTMLGHDVTVYTWKDAASEDAVQQLLSDRYYAAGTGWTAGTLEDNATTDAEQAVAKAVMAAIGGQMVHATGTPPS
jgi:hypothetical protein